jgi:hypothetical protein
MGHKEGASGGARPHKKFPPKGNAAPSERPDPQEKAPIDAVSFREWQGAVFLEGGKAFISLKAARAAINRVVSILFKKRNVQTSALTASEKAKANPAKAEVAMLRAEQAALQKRLEEQTAIMTEVLSTLKKPSDPPKVEAEG